MSRTVKFIVFVLLPGVVVFAGYYIYSRAAVTSAHAEAEKKLDGIYMVRGTGTLTSEMVRERVSERMKALGLEVRSADVDVHFETLDDENIHELPAQVRMGMDLTSELQGDEMEMHVLKIKFPLVIRKGLVKRRYVVERVFGFKGIVEDY